MFDLEAWNRNRYRRQARRKEAINQQAIQRLAKAIKRRGFVVECPHTYTVTINAADIELDGVAIEVEPLERCLNCRRFVVTTAPGGRYV